MTDRASITVRATAHPVAHVHRAGFPLDHPYIERCWTPVLGPSSVLLLRRMPEVFRQAPAAVVHLDELASSLGIGGTGHHSAIRRTLDRLAQFRFAAWTGDDQLDVYTEAPPLHARQLERVPESTRRDHATLLAAHLDDLAAPPPPTADLVARLDRLRRPTTVPRDTPLAR